MICSFLPQVDALLNRNTWNCCRAWILIGNNSLLHITLTSVPLSSKLNYTVVLLASVCRMFGNISIEHLRGPSQSGHGLIPSSAHRLF